MVRTSAIFVLGASRLKGLRLLTPAAMFDHDVTLSRLNNLHIKDVRILIRSIKDVRISIRLFVIN